MWKKPLALLGTSAVVCAGEMARELSGFRVRRYRKVLPGLEKGRKIRVLFLSDLHGKEYGKENRRLLEKVEQERPDCILTGGDMLTRTQPETDRTALALMRRLASAAPVYAANGNHEQKMKVDRRQYGDRYERYRHALLEAGIRVLENETCLFQKEGFQAAITGLELPLSCYSHLGREELQVEEIEERIGERSGDTYRILMAHNPAYMDVYWEWGADLVLSGHLHGGVVRLPLVGGVITPQMKLFPRYSGDMYKGKDGQSCVVSRGLGTHTVNVRLYNMAELVSLTFVGKQG